MHTKAAFMSEPTPRRRRSHRPRYQRLWKQYKRTIISVAVTVFFLALFLICLRYLTQEHSEQSTQLAPPAQQAG